VVEKYFEQVLTMLELGGIDMLGHFDKIIGNAALADPSIETQKWYEALVDDVVSHAAASGVVVEINTKAILDKGRFFPDRRWWDKLKSAGVPVAINSDAHYPDKVNLGRAEALSLWEES
jgi:histidinol-phosphatase (PHP family)